MKARNWRRFWHRAYIVACVPWLAYFAWQTAHLVRLFAEYGYSVPPPWEPIGLMVAGPIALYALGLVFNWVWAAHEV